MAFIKSTNEGHAAHSLQPPPTPALKSIFYWLAALTIIATLASWRIDDPVKTDPSTAFAARLIITAAGLLLSLVFFGIGQIIGYLGTTAHYSQITAELLNTQKIDS